MLRTLFGEDVNQACHQMLFWIFQTHSVLLIVEKCSFSSGAVGLNYWTYLPEISCLREFQASADFYSWLTVPLTAQWFAALIEFYQTLFYGYSNGNLTDGQR
jgi:hypothetical protein